VKPCPHPEKVRYSTKKRALQAANRLHAHGFELRMRPYKCVCHGWHLTKKGAVEAEIAKLIRSAA
jgi:hypothetical protein